MGLDDTFLILPGYHVHTVHCPHNFRKQNIGVQRYGCAVVKGFAALIGNDGTGDFQTVHLHQRIGNGGLIDDLQLGNFVGSQLTLFRHSSLLALAKCFMA